MRKFLTIAASDSSGGAGIQRDLIVAHDHGFWGMNILTGLTTQTLDKVYSLIKVNLEFLKDQLQVITENYSFNTVKIGVIPSLESVQMISSYIKSFDCPVILDPVFISSSDFSFFSEKYLQLYKDLLLPYCSIITPNKKELELLTDKKIHNFEEAILAGKDLSHQYKIAVYVKGGHYDGEKIKEALINASHISEFEFPRYYWKYTHGTGCVFSSALACNLVTEEFVNQAIQKSHLYLTDFFNKIC